MPRVPLMPPEKVMSEYGLEVRCKLLEIAAVLDRHARSGGGPDDPDLARIRDALAVLSNPQPHPNRAEQVALIYSGPVSD